MDIADLPGTRSLWLLTLLSLILVLLMSAALVFVIHSAILAADTAKAIGQQNRQILESNAGIIREIRTDLNIHADASAERSCALAKELRSIGTTVTANPQAADIRALDAYVRMACQVEPIPNG